MKFMYVILVTIFMLAMLPVHASADRYLNGKFITNGAYTLTVPLATDTLVGKETSDVLKNKTMSGADNTFSNIPTGAIAGSALSGTNTGDVTLGTANGLSLIGQQLSLGIASSSAAGALSAADWSTFNSKQPALGFTAVPDTRQVNGHALTSDVTVTKSDVGLSAVTNDAQVKVSDYAVKGEILVATGSASYTALGVGANGYVLTAASGQASGLQWSPVPSVSPSLNGGSASPESVTAGSGISLTSVSFDNDVWVVGNAGAVIITATPSVTACAADGQFLEIYGTSDTNTVKLQDQANLVGSGLSLNGDWIGAKDSTLGLHCDFAQSLWVESYRR